MSHRQLRRAKNFIFRHPSILSLTWLTILTLFMIGAWRRHQFGSVAVLSFGCGFIFHGWTVRPLLNQQHLLILHFRRYISRHRRLGKRLLRGINES